MKVLIETSKSKKIPTERQGQLVGDIITIILIHNFENKCLQHFFAKNCFLLASVIEDWRALEKQHN